MDPVIAQITGRLWLGNIAAAQDAGILREHKITGVLNVSETPYLSSVECFVCPLRDDERNQSETLLAASLLLHELISRHDRALVHCQHGGSRSVAVLMLYLRLNDVAKSFDEARAYIQARYPIKLSARQPRPGLRELLNTIWGSLEERKWRGP